MVPRCPRCGIIRNPKIPFCKCGSVAPPVFRPLNPPRTCRNPNCREGIELVTNENYKKNEQIPPTKWVLCSNPYCPFKNDKNLLIKRLNANISLMASWNAFLKKIK